MLAHVRWRTAGRKWSKQMERLVASINDTCTALAVGRTTVYAMLADGRLEAIKVGRRRLVKMESIRRLIDAQA